RRLRALSSGRHKAPSAEWLLPFTASCWWRNGSHCGDALVSGAAVLGSMVLLASVSPPTTAFCRGSPRGVSHSNLDAATTVEKTAEKFIKFLLRSRVGRSAAFSGPTALTRGANTLSA